MAKDKVNESLEFRGSSTGFRFCLMAFCYGVSSTTYLIGVVGKAI